MSKNKIFIIGVGFSNLNFNKTLEEIQKYMEQGTKEEIKPLVIFTPNPEIAVLAQKDENFRKIVNSAQINIPDGQGIVWASRFLGRPLPERITGTDLMEKLAKMAAEKGFSIGLIGGGPKIAVKALECLKKKYPRLNGWAEEGPWINMEHRTWNMEHKALFEKTDILFVGMGAPKQEYFIYQATRNMGHGTLPTIFMAVGGAFDYLSGNLPRAPLVIRKIGFEWVFRLIRQPWRIKRQLALIKFILLVFKQKFSS